MMEVRSDDARANVIAGISSQPIALAAAALVIIVVGAVSIALWRVTTGASPEQDRTASARLLQARVAQVSEQLIEKTKGLEVSQQESIDQLQVVQDQLKVVKSLLTAQQTETKRLSEQVGNLASAIDTLRQSFASTQSSSEASKPASTRKTSVRRPHATRGRVAGAHRKRAKSRG
jgi:septal ring factor EnvC (AmiA/AmiB activator)